MKGNQMDIIEFFDPYNMEHVRAYEHLQKTGQWPKGFIPKRTLFPTNWHLLIINKLANAWVHYMIKNFTLKDIINGKDTTVG